MSDSRPSDLDETTRRRNLWAVSLTSFFTDVSSEMVLNLLPLYLSAVLGVKTNVIGLIEGVAESLSSLLKLVSGRFSDRWQARKWLAVTGYGISAASKPLFLWASSWTSVAAARWGDRVGKGVRTAPRDALLADSAAPERRGLVFGLHRAADSAGAVIGLAIALVVVWQLQGAATELSAAAFRAVVLWSLPPAFLAVVILAALARDVPLEPSSSSAGQAVAIPAAAKQRVSWRRLGRPFLIFLAIASLFDLGNSSDAFLVLRAAERGLGVVGILAMLLAFNLVYAVTSTPAGRLSDRFGRRRVLIAGWSLYAVVYGGLALADSGRQVVLCFIVYGAYHGLSHGTAKAFVADLVPKELRGTAYGIFHATLGVIDLPASVIAGVLWQGAFGWGGWGPAAPFVFGAVTALLASLLLAIWRGRQMTH